jgi:hypothetical protein
MRRLLPDVLLIVGVAIGLGGVYLLWGLPIVLLTLGILLAVYGALLDLRWR